MNRCICCGIKLVRQWAFSICGPCNLSVDRWDETYYEQVLQDCRERMDPRLRSLPFFTPLGPKKPTLREELGEELS